MINKDLSKLLPEYQEINLKDLKNPQAQTYSVPWKPAAATNPNPNPFAASSSTAPWPELGGESSDSTDADAYEVFVADADSDEDALEPYAVDKEIINEEGVVIDRPLSQIYFSLSNIQKSSRLRALLADEDTDIEMLAHTKLKAVPASKATKGSSRSTRGTKRTTGRSTMDDGLKESNRMSSEVTGKKYEAKATSPVVPNDVLSDFLKAVDENDGHSSRKVSPTESAKAQSGEVTGWNAKGSYKAKRIASGFDASEARPQAKSVVVPDEDILGDFFKAVDENDGHSSRQVSPTDSAQAQSGEVTGWNAKGSYKAKRLASGFDATESKPQAKRVVVPNEDVLSDFFKSVDDNDGHSSRKASPTPSARGRSEEDTIWNAKGSYKAKRLASGFDATEVKTKSEPSRSASAPFGGSPEAKAKTQVAAPDDVLGDFFKAVDANKAKAGSAAGDTKPKDAVAASPKGRRGWSR